MVEFIENQINALATSDAGTSTVVIRSGETVLHKVPVKDTDFSRKHPISG